MNKLFVTFFLICIVSVMGNTTETYAQRYDEAQYDYADSNTGVIYNLYMKFNGYQVQVWMKNNQQKDWSPCTVTSSNDDVISFKLGATQYHAKLDPNNTDAVVVYNGAYSQKWKYYKKQ